MISIVKEICNEFKVHMPMVTFVPEIDKEAYGRYYHMHPIGHIVIFEDAPKGTLEHELVHHVCRFNNQKRYFKESEHGPFFQSRRQKLERRGWYVDSIGRRDRAIAAN